MAIAGCTRQSKVGVGGDSAGGRISASIAHDEPVDFQVCGSRATRHQIETVDAEQEAACQLAKQYPP